MIVDQKKKRSTCFYNVYFILFAEQSKWMKQNKICLRTVFPLQFVETLKKQENILVSFSLTKMDGFSSKKNGHS